jgi:exosortase
MNVNHFSKLLLNFPSRNICFLLICIAIIYILVEPLKELVKFSFHNRLYSHFFLIPLVIAYFFVKDRKNIFAEIGFSPYWGTALIITGLGISRIGAIYKTNLISNDYLCLMTLAAVTCFIGSFMLLYGNRVFRKGLFPLALLFFMMPIPTLIMDPLVKILVAGSAQTTEWIFRVIHVPYIREGFIFELPGIAIEIVEGCSGIRSALVLFIFSIIFNYLFLKTAWRRIILTLTIFPITIFNNALRISTLSLLASYVDSSWVTENWLHDLGSKPAFGLALMFLIFVLWLLRRSEKKRNASQVADVDSKEPGGSYNSLTR